MSNSVYGKTIEETRSRIDMVIARTPETFMKLVADARFDSYRILNDNLVICFLKQRTVKLNKPYPIGFTILEASKLQMYRQYYTVLTPHFKTMKLLFTDTDSVMAEVDSNNITHNLQALKDHFDFSNYPNTHPLYDPSCKNVTGLWKDETKGLCEITRFVGLKSKTYAYETRDLTTNTYKEKITSKGVNKGAKKQLHLENYLKCLNEVASIRANVVSIRSSNYTLMTTQLNKLALSSFDDKRWLYSCGIHSSPYNSCLISVYNSHCPYCPNRDTYYDDDSNVIMIDVHEYYSDSESNFIDVK